MNFDSGKIPTGPTGSYTCEIPKPKQHDIIIVGDNSSYFSTGAQRTHALILRKIGYSVQEVADTFDFISTVFSDIKSPIENFHEAMMNPIFHDAICGPDFDNRSWAFLEQQQIVFEKQLRNKKYLFPKTNNKQTLFKLRSMDSRSGYRGVKAIRRS